jgi:A/G-specific adenine glycosylase
MADEVTPIAVRDPPASLLLAWYERHRRDLPWRRSRDPYRILLSEVMLQQTRVDVVVPYYERFVARFPSAEALAAASVDDVLAQWSGLGYYRRARQLHAAARQLVASGGLPTTAAGLVQLPGIGPYTAAAVASIAFGEAVPVLDGNVERVLARWLGRSEVRGTAARRALRKAASNFLVPGRAGDSNQALMELGATLCTPRQPQCPRCPLRGDCAALRQGAAERYPSPRRRRPPARRHFLVAVAERDGRVLLFRRSEESALLAGTWELPWVDAESSEAERDLAAKYGGRWQLGPAAGRVRHTVTFRALAANVHSVRLGSEEPLRPGVTAGWFDAEERAALPLSALVWKALARVRPAADQPASRSASRRPG